jgi:HEAT repeat protein
VVAIATREAERFGTSDSVAYEVRASEADPGAARALALTLPDGDPEERAALARVLGWLADPSTAKPLIELLADETSVARAASAALANLGGAAVEELLSALMDGDSARRMVLLPSVPARPDVGEAVSACLSDPLPDVRALACELLARAQAVSAVPRLFDLLADPDRRVVQAAVAAIQALGHEQSEALTLAAARSSSRRARRAAIRILGYFGWRSGLEPLVEALGTGDVRLRDAALHSLAFLDDPRAVQAILDVSDDPDPAARAAAMRALGSSSSGPAVLARVSAGLTDPAPWVRYYACQAIGRLHAHEFVDALVRRLADPAGQVKIAVIDALAQLPDPRATAALLTAASSGDGEVARAALLGLGSSCPPEGLPLILEATTAGDVPTRVIALSALVRYEGPMVEQTLVRAVRTDLDESVRATALGILGGRPGIDATAALVALAREPELCERAVDALATAAPGRIPGILLALEREDADCGPLVSALARLGRPAATAALGVALAMDRPAPRRAAAAAISALGAGLLRSQLERVAADDPDPEVRRLARRALAWR